MKIHVYSGYGDAGQYTGKTVAELNQILIDRKKSIDAAQRAAIRSAVDTVRLEATQYHRGYR